MQRVWLIRVDAQHIDPMRRAGLIGVQYGEVGDATMLTSEEIEQALIDARRSGVGQLRARLQHFANDMRPGDLVVTPNSARREVWLSIITGDYRFEQSPDVEGCAHARTVDWLGWIDRDAHWMGSQLKVIEQPVEVAELYNREWWWGILDTRELVSTPRATWSKPASPARARTSSRGTAQPKPTPKPKPAALVLCSGSCGLQWSPYVLVDGQCPDCRGE